MLLLIFYSLYHITMNGKINYYYNNIYYSNIYILYDNRLTTVSTSNRFSYAIIYH